MFYATLFACSLITHGCAEFIDERGPYATFEECTKRIEEMVEFTPTVGYKPIAFKCEKKGTSV